MNVNHVTMPIVGDHLAQEYGDIKPITVSYSQLNFKSFEVGLTVTMCKAKLKQSEGKRDVEENRRIEE